MANIDFKDFKGSTAKFALVGGSLVITADFGMAIFNPAIWTIPWYILAAIGYIGFVMAVPFVIWLYKRLT
jgi:hypothetical protein